MQRAYKHFFLIFLAPLWPRDFSGRCEIIKAAQLSENDFFGSAISKDLMEILSTIRENHGSDPTTADTTGTDMVKNALDTATHFEGSPEEAKTAMFLSKLVLSGNDFTSETIPADYPGGWEGYVATETAAMRLPYLILALVLLTWAVLIWVAKLPKITEGGQEEGSEKGAKLIDFNVLKRSHLRGGVIAQFFYNGGQTALNSMFLIYCCKYVGLTEARATTFFGIYMLMFLLGRWVGTLLMGRFKPQNMLYVYALANVALCLVVVCCGGMTGLYAMIAISFFMSIMYPTQFSLAIDDLGAQTKSGSAFLVMAIVGNVVIPPLTGLIMDHNPQTYHIAYILPLSCFAVCAWYGLSGYKIKN